MSHWISLFYRGPEQLLPLVVAPLLWIGLAGIGYLVSGRGRTVEAMPYFGWAMVSALFTLVGIVVPGSFFVLSVITAIAAVGGIGLALSRRDPLFTPGSWRILVLALPLLVIASAMHPLQWDEFSHWLPAPRYLYVINGFPTIELPYLGPQMLSAYPYGWPLLIMLAARLAGGFLNNVGGLLNVLMLLTISNFALRTGCKIAGRPLERTIGWGFAAVVALAAAAINPTFVQKIVLTSYSDIATSTTTAICLLLAFRLASRLGGHDPGSVRSAAGEVGLVLSLLVNLRQPNLVIFAALLLATALVVWRDPQARLAHLMRLMPIVVLPPLVIYIAWRYYVATKLAGLPNGEAGFLPFASWNIAVIPRILLAMLVVIVKKIAYFLPMFIAVAIGLRAMVREGGALSRLYLAAAVVFVGYNAFLLFVYVASFSSRDALVVTGYWRYNIDVGATAIVVIVAGLLVLWQRRKDLSDRSMRIAARTAIVAVLLLPVGLATKLRFDLEPPTAFYTEVANDLVRKGLLSARIFLVDPHGTGEAGVITRFYLGSEGEPWISAFQYDSPQTVLTYASGVPSGGYLLIHSVAPGVSDAVGRTLDPRVSYLFKRTDTGWEQVASWNKPANQPS